MKKVIVAQKADERLIEKLRTAAEPVLMQEGDLETLEREIGGADGHHPRNLAEV